MSEEAERLYERARALEPGARAVFVEEACRGVPQLREELVSLLAEAEAAEEFFDFLGDAVFSGPFPIQLEEGDGGAGGQASIDPAPPLPRIELPIGTTIGRYRILSLIGSGGMGVVYRAYDASLERDVALKFLPPLSTRLDDEARLLREARAAAALEHPNICTVHEIGQTEDGQPFIAMALYEGETLKERLRQGPLPVEEAVTTAVQIARALSAAHARGIVHRDVKPGNVILGPDGTVRLLDFGIAQAIDATLTDSAMTPGTAAYMSPEQVRGDPVDPRTDLWSLGVVLYETLVGERPFHGEDDTTLLEGILHADPEPVSSRRTEVPPRLERIVERLLQKDRDARFGKAADVLADLAHALPSEPRVVTRRRSALAGAAALVVLFGALWLPERRGASVPAVNPRYRSANLAAYELFLRADPTMSRNDIGFRERIGYLRQAIVIDSTYAAAYAELADNYARMGDPLTNAQDELLEAAEKTARKALALDDSLGTAYSVLSIVRLSEGDYASAESLIRHAIAMDPIVEGFYTNLAEVLIAAGRPAEALAETQRALEIDPSGPYTIVAFAEALFANGRYDEALARLEPVLAIRPRVRRAFLLAGKCYIMKGMWAEALSVLRPLAGEEGPRARYLLAYALARGRQVEEAQRILTELLAGHERGKVPAFDVAVVYAGFGDIDQAFAWLDKAVDEKMVDWELIKEPLFEDLHRDPRFERLRQRLGL
ncbi:MAG TPA: protein kinase [Gemmatimonadota bacterium]|nr:protein kinase [Gemmatimonadota bacterium]